MTEDRDITLSVNAYRVNALEAALDSTIEDVLYDHLERLYDAAVPEEEQEKVETLVQADEDEADRYYEESRRFALLSITQNGESVCYEYDNCPSLLTAARWFVDALQENEKKPFDDGYRSDPAYMDGYIRQYGNDPRVTLCAEINHDKGYMHVWCGSYWVEYNAERLTEAVLAADQERHLTDEQREKIFEDTLNKDNPEYWEDEDEGMSGIQM